MRSGGVRVVPGVCACDREDGRDEGCDELAEILLIYRDILQLGSGHHNVVRQLIHTLTVIGQGALVGFEYLDQRIALFNLHLQERGAARLVMPADQIPGIGRGLQQGKGFSNPGVEIGVQHVIKASLVCPGLAGVFE